MNRPLPTRLPNRAPALVVAALAFVAGVAASSSAQELQAPLPRAPEPLGPGAPDATPVVASPCPTFHWSVPPAEGGELAEIEVGVLRIVESEGELELEAVRSFRVSPQARLLTPDLAQCLEPGERYAWWLRPVLATDRPGSEPRAGAWSEPRFFEVAAVPELREVERALQVLEAYRAAVVDRPATRAGDAVPSEARDQTEERPVRVAENGILGSPDQVALRGRAPDGVVSIGVVGETDSEEPGSAGVIGVAAGRSGATVGVGGEVASPDGVAGEFDNSGGGTIVLGRSGGLERFAVRGSGRLEATGPLRIGAVGDALAYSAIGSGAASQGAVSNADDLFVADDLEVDGTLYADGFLTIRNNLSVGNGSTDDEDLIFFDGGLESLMWDDSLDRFRITSGLDVLGPMEVTAGLEIGGDLVVGSFSSTDDDAIVFDGSKRLFWDESLSRFGFTDALEVEGNLVVGSSLFLGGASGSDDDIVYFDTGIAEFLAWDDSQSEFDLSDSLHLTDGVVRVGVSVSDCSSGGCPSEYSAFEAPFSSVTAPAVPSPSGPLSGRINNPGSVWVQNSLEVGSILFSRLISSARINGVSTGADLAIGSNNSLAFFIDTDDDSGSNERFEWWANTNYSRNDPSNRKVAELLQDGQLRIRKTIIENTSFDVAESFVALDAVVPGEVVSIDPHRSDSLRRSAIAADPKVLGVVSRQPGFWLGGPALSLGALEEAWGPAVAERFRDQEERLRAEALANDEDLRREIEEEALASADRERVLRRAALELFFEHSFAPVALAGRVPVRVDAGPGAIRVGDLLTSAPTPGYAMRADPPLPGTILGKALEPLETGTGEVLMLVLPR